MTQIVTAPQVIYTGCLELESESMKRPALFAIATLAVTVFLGGPFTAGAISGEEATRAVITAYEDVLGRKPDEAGLRAYRSKMVDEGWSEQDVRKALRKSAEYRTAEAQKAVKIAYRDVLGRDPDSGGLAHYVKMMLEHNWTEKDVREALRKSDEAKNKKR